jgi:hypothetical protein
MIIGEKTGIRAVNIKVRPGVNGGGLRRIRIWVLVWVVYGITAISAGCQSASISKVSLLDIDELNQLIAEKTRQLEALQRNQDILIQEKGGMDSGTKDEIRQLEVEISKMIRWRQRLIHLEGSGRISGPI